MQQVSGLQIRLFGGLLLESSGRDLPRIPSRVGRSLFAYLVLHRDQEITRDLLAGVFWPDMPDPRARRRLSQALWQVQTHLADCGVGSEYLLTEPHAVRFNATAPYWLDVEAFEDALAGFKSLPEGAALTASELQELAAKVELYRGDLLSGFYDDWILVEQQRLRQSYLEALGHLAVLYKSRGEFEPALTYARRLALTDPLREDAHREVMRLSFLAGRANDALLQYEVCWSTLQDELGTEPEAATTELFESIAAQRDAGRAPFLPAARSPLLDVSTPIPLVGRKEPRAGAVAMVEGALGGRGGIVLVEGEAGVGKTRLLEAIAEDASWRGLGVVWGESVEEGPSPSYAPLTVGLSRAITHLVAEQLAAQIDGVWLQEIGRLIPRVREWLPRLPEPARLKPAEEPERMLEAISNTMIGLGRITPQLIVLDDFHWADADTVAAIRHLANRLNESNLVLCLAYRSGPARERAELWETLRHLDASAPTLRVPLAVLNDAETRELIRLSSEAEVDDALAARLHEETGGSPLFVLETLRAMHEHQVAAVTGDGGDVSPEFPLPDTVHELISRRLQTLSPAQRHVLNIFAVLGMEADADRALAASSGPRPEFFENLAALTHKGILHEHHGRYRFRHQQVQRVADLEIPARERQALHHELGRALVSRHDEAPEIIAHHFAGAGEAVEAVQYSEQAALVALEQRAYANAAAHYQTALEWVGPAQSSAEVRFRLLAGHEGVLDVVGRRSEQEATLASMEALVVELPELGAAVSRRRAWHLAHTDEFRQAATEARRALAADSAAGDDAAVAEDHHVLGMINLWSGDPSQAIRHLRDAVDTATGRRLADVREALGRALSAVQQYSEAADESKTALALFDAADDRRGQAEALGSLGIITMEQGHAEESLSYYQRAIDVCREIGYRHGEGVNTVNLGNALWYAGWISGALEKFARAIEIFGVIGNRRGQALVEANAASLHHTLGDDKTAAAYCRRALEYFTEVDNADGAAQVLCNLADISRRAGRLDEAEDYLATALHSIETTGNQWLAVQALQSRALLQLAQDLATRAVATADKALRLCRRLGLTDFEAGLLSVRGVALLALGDTRQGAESTAEAVKRLKSGTDQAYLVPFRHALALRELEREDEAADLFRQAHDLLAETLRDLSDSQKAVAMAVPELRAIAEAMESVEPTLLTVRLARKRVPTGRPLTDSDRTAVHWTITSPEDDGWKDPVERRRGRLRRLLQEADGQDAAPTVDDLAQALDVSVRTIRRDLASLRANGFRASTRGHSN